MSAAKHEQTELFGASAEPEIAGRNGKWKTFFAAGGREIRYGVERDMITPLDFGNGEKATVRRYKKRTGSDQFRMVHPRYGKVFSRFSGLKAFLAAVSAAISSTVERERAESAEGEAALARERERQARARAEAAEEVAATARQSEREASALMASAILSSDVGKAASRVRNRRLAPETRRVEQGCLSPAKVPCCRFGMALDWIEARTELSHSEKRIYGWLFGQARALKVAKIEIFTVEICAELGVSESGLRLALKRMRDECGLVAYADQPGARSRLISFPIHEWMPASWQSQNSTSPENSEVEDEEAEQPRHSQREPRHGKPPTSPENSGRYIEENQIPSRGTTQAQSRGNDSTPPASPEDPVSKLAREGRLSEAVRLSIESAR